MAGLANNRAVYIAGLAPIILGALLGKSIILPFGAAQATVQHNPNNAIDAVKVEPGWSSQGEPVFAGLGQRKTPGYYAIKSKHKDRIVTVFNRRLSEVSVPDGRKLYQSAATEEFAVQDHWVPALDFFNIHHESVGNIIFVVEYYVVSNDNALCNAVAGKAHFVADAALSSASLSIVKSIARSVERLPLGCDLPVNMKNGQFQLKPYYRDGREMVGLNENLGDFYSYNAKPISQQQIWQFLDGTGQTL